MQLLAQNTNYNSKLQLFKMPENVLQSIYDSLENSNALASTCKVFNRELQEYHSRKPIYTILADCTQGLCAGFLNKEKALEVLKKVKINAPATILFDESQLSWWISGGNCSAIALNFIKKYYNKHLREKPLNEWKQELASLSRKYSYTGMKLKFKNEQMAFNSFSVRKDLCEQFKNETLDTTKYDLARDKVQSFVNFYGFNIVSTTEQYDISSDTKNVLIQQVNNLPQGIHILRCIKPLQNLQLEDYGHTMFLIKEQERMAFFNCNTSVEILEKHPALRVFEQLKLCHTKYELTQSRFYQLKHCQS